MIKGFFAYPALPSIQETITDAIKSINGADVVDITGWEKVKTPGLTLIHTICDYINNSDIFLADLTFLNANVLFELGYAIAKNKRILSFLDTSIEKSKNNFERFGLSTLGYIPYNNSQDIVNGFFKIQPYSDLDKTLLNEIQNFHSAQVNGLLYLKSSFDTQASIKLTQKIEKSRIKPLTIDDPHEVRMQVHNWYIENAYKNFAFVGHLLSDEQSGKELHNAKVSFSAGLAYGFGRKIIMLAHEPYECPLDYKHLLRKHLTATDCEKFFNNWIIDVESQYLQEQKKEIQISITQKDIEGLKNIDLGDYIAENEIEISSHSLSASCHVAHPASKGAASTQWWPGPQIVLSHFMTMPPAGPVSPVLSGKWFSRISRVA